MSIFTLSPSPRATSDEISRSTAVVIRIARDLTVRVDLFADTERDERDIAESILASIQAAVRVMRRDLVQRS
jgi:hypothetical protein